MTWRPSKSPRECSGINRRDTVSCFVIHKYGNGKQRLLVAAEPCASSPATQSQRVHTKERRTELRPTLLTNVGSPWLQWLLITDAARPSQPARPFGAVQKAARRPCLVVNTLIMGQRLAWPGCV